MEVIIAGVEITKVNEYAKGTCNYDCGTYR